MEPIEQVVLKILDQILAKIGFCPICKKSTGHTKACELDDVIKTIKKFPD